MFRNYFKTAWRNLAKNKIFTAINIAGLSVGLAACLLILQYVSFQLSFDRFNPHAEDVYRVTNDRYQHGKLIQHGTITYSGVAKAMAQDFPEVVNYTRVRPRGGILINGEKKLGEQPGLYVDNAFLDILAYPLLAGDKNTALKEPNTILLTERAARGLFDVKGNDFGRVIGQSVLRDNDDPYRVTGILKDVPDNSHLDFQFLASYVTLYAGRNGWKKAEHDFTESDFWHYVQLRPGTDYKTVEARLPAFSDRYFQGSKVSGSVEKFFLQPLTRAHLYSDYEYEIGRTASATVVWGMLAIALLIIVIAWINYINLTTAKSAERAREVGVRKVSGATKGQLVKQFLTESLLINLVALGIGLGLVSLAQPAFNTLIGYQLSLFNLLEGWSGIGFIGLLSVAMLLGILVSGFYPAFVLSSFKPVLVLKGKYVNTAKGINLRKALVIGQFAVTVVLVIGAMVVYNQMRFMSKQSLGYNLSQVVTIQPPQLTHWDSSFIGKMNTLQAELKQLPGVREAANSWSVAGGEMGRDFDFRRTNNPEGGHFTTRKTGVSPEFIKVYDIKLLAGRNLGETDYNTDPSKVHNVMINANASRLLGFKTPEAAIGQQVHVAGQDWDVVGVFGDFHQKSLHYPLEPLVMYPLYSQYSTVSVKVDTKDITATMALVKARYDAIFPGNLFDYRFVDDQFEAQYANDRLFGRIFGIFSGLAIFIACLGLLGLSLFSTLQRTKEIGVRKVLGASIASIVVLLSREFVRLVLIAFIIASPVAWYLMNNWLNDFAYRINISAWTFLVAGLMALLVALVTISFQAIRAAVTNPVKSLRAE